MEEVVPTSRTIQEPWYSSPTSDVDSYDGYRWRKYGELPVLIKEFSQLSMFLSQFSGVIHRPNQGRWVVEIRIPGQPKPFRAEIIIPKQPKPFQAEIRIPRQPSSKSAPPISRLRKCSDELELG